MHKGAGLADLQTWLDSGRKGELADNALPEGAGELAQSPQLEADLGRLRETIALLMTPEREARQKRLGELDSQKTNLERNVGRLLKANEEFDLRTRPHREAIESAVDDLRSTGIIVTESRTALGRRHGATDEEIQAFLTRN